MRFATAILMALGLFSSPLACFIQPCHFEVEAHDCCPQKTVRTACPFEILDSAKATPALHVAPAPAITYGFVAAPELVQIERVREGAVSVDLHLLNRVLRL